MFFFVASSSFGKEDVLSSLKKLKIKGLISEDRGNKTTLQLTIPRSLFKSSAKDVYPDIHQSSHCDVTKMEVSVRHAGPAVAPIGTN